MKRIISIAICIFIFQVSKGQDTLRRFEFGSTLATVNSFNTQHYYAAERPPVEFMNGLFFRYYRKRFALRAHASYSDNSMSYATPSGWADASSGDIHNKDIRIGAGAQFSIVRHKEWFYTFLDLSYRNVFSTGHAYGGFGGASDQFSRTSNGLDSYFGLGFKIRALKNVFLSPELGYLLSTNFTNESSTSMISGQTVKHSYTEGDLNLVLKLHLTVKF